jgi:CRP-like cAMP-binding protein
LAEPIGGGQNSSLNSPSASAICGNLLLRSLESRDFALIRPYLERVRLDRGHVIAAQNEPITFVCFPESGVTSVADVMDDGTRVEIALVGREGMTNCQLLLGCDHAPHEAAVQIGDGSSLRLRADLLREFTARSPAAHALFLRFVHALAIQTARTLTSNLRDPAEVRLARWLLMCHDRIDGDEIQLGHADISRMLGVRRATVTDALHLLEGHAALRSSRGRIVVRDRFRLEELAGSSYGFAEHHYRRLIAPFGKNLRPVRALPNSALR